MRKWLLSGVAGVVVAIVALAPVAMAATSSAPASGSSGQGLEISPPVIELSANPGQTVTTAIRVRNVTTGELITKGKADDFGAGTDESGQPKILLDETGATRYSLKYWISGVADEDLAPGELKTTSVVINVPANAEPGGHYGVVRFTALPPSLSGTGVALSASVGALILLRVNGAITDQLSMAEFSTLQSGRKNALWEHGPLDFLVRVKNDGTVHEKPTGNITVTDMVGHKVATVAVNSLGGNVLPGSIRRFEQTLNNKKLLGYYTANVALAYAGNKTLTSKLGFWVIPWRLILLIVVGLVILFFVLRLALKKYNEHIIKMAGRR